MLDLSPAKLLVIVIVAVILLGPDKLPQVARQVGAAWRKLRDFQQRVDQEVRQNVPDLPSTQEIARFARSPMTVLNRWADAGARGRARRGPGRHRRRRRRRRCLAGGPAGGRHDGGSPRSRLVQLGDWPGSPDRPGADRRSGHELSRAMAIPLLSRRKTRPTPDAMTLSEHLAELRRRLVIADDRLRRRRVGRRGLLQPHAQLPAAPVLRGQPGQLPALRHEPARRPLTAGEDGGVRRPRRRVAGHALAALAVHHARAAATEKRYAVPFVAGVDRPLRRRLCDRVRHLPARPGVLEGRRGTEPASRSTTRTAT